MIIGLARDEVRIVSYQEDWQALFEEEVMRLRSLFKNEFLQAEHIGSTSIVGMEAKPIIDLMVAIPRFDGAKVLIPEIETIGYEFLPDEPPHDRLFLAKGPRSARTHHLSLAEPTSLFWANMILFRDTLKSHPHLAQEYHVLKKELAEKYAKQRTQYTRGKQAFVEAVLKMARTTP